jgi:hypothetical protein
MTAGVQIGRCFGRQPCTTTVGPAAWVDAPATASQTEFDLTPHTTHIHPPAQPHSCQVCGCTDGMGCEKKDAEAPEWTCERIAEWPSPPLLTLNTLTPINGPSSKRMLNDAPQHSLSQPANLNATSLCRALSITRRVNCSSQLSRTRPWGSINPRQREVDGITAVRVAPSC